MSNWVRLSNDCSPYLLRYSCSILKPITKVYGLLYGLQRYEENIGEKSHLILFSLEVNNYLLSCPLNDDKLYLYQTKSKESDE